MCVHTGTPDCCFDCDRAAHADLHPVPADGCRTCKLLSIQLSPRVNGHGTPKHSGTPAGNNNSWEKGLVTDHRGVPLLAGHDLHPVRVKEYAQHHHAFEARRRELASSPAPFKPE